MKRLSVSLKGFIFTPHLVSILLMVILLPILMGLGVWQLNRAELKRGLLAQYENRIHSAPLHNLQQAKRQQRYYPVQLTGKFDNQHTILLDNKMHQHRVGYQVLTPFVMGKSQRVVLVNRGWIPIGQSRRQLPAIKPVLGEVTVAGLLDFPPAKYFSLSAQLSASQTWPWRVQHLDLQKIAQRLPYNLIPSIILLSPQSAYGFTREWKPITVKPEKHTAYAVQWFALALTLMIIFIGVNLRRKVRKNP